AALTPAACGGSSSTTSTLTRTARRAKAAPAKKPATLSELADQVHGRVVTPNSAGYHRASEVYNEIFDGARPVAIVEASREADVQAAVRWAADRDISIVPRAGGHSYAGYSTGSGVLVVDVAGLDSIAVHRGAGFADIGACSQ